MVITQENLNLQIATGIRDHKRRLKSEGRRFSLLPLNWSVPSNDVARCMLHTMRGHIHSQVPCMNKHGRKSAIRTGGRELGATKIPSNECAKKPITDE